MLFEATYHFSFCVTSVTIALDPCISFLLVSVIYLPFGSYQRSDIAVMISQWQGTYTPKVDGHGLYLLLLIMLRHLRQLI